MTPQGFSRMVGSVAHRLSLGVEPEVIRLDLSELTPGASAADLDRAMRLGEMAVEAGKLGEYAAIAGPTAPAFPPQLVGALGGNALVTFDAGPAIGQRSVMLRGLDPGITFEDLQAMVDQAVADKVRANYPADVGAAVRSAVVRYLVPNG